jgi:hypothetical protein
MTFIELQTLGPSPVLRHQLSKCNLDKREIFYC